MEDNNKSIEVLLERFFEGQTSAAEEEQLYRFFAEEEVPASLLRYKSLFAYFETGIKEELAEQAVSVRHMQRSKWLLWTGIAAAVLLLILLSPFVHSQKSFDPYEGSYIVRNGVRITDLDIIRPELDATVRYALEQEKKMERIGEELTEMEKPSFSVEEYIRLQKNEIIDRFQDENIRREVRNIIEN